VSLDVAAPASLGGRHLGVGAIGPDRVRANAELVAAYGGVDESEAGSARAALFEALNRIQPWPFAWRREPAEPVLTFGDEPHFHPETLAHVMIVDELPEDWRYPPGERPPLAEGVARGRELLRDVAPGTLEGLDLLIGELLFGRRSLKSGGSMSSVVGVIWLGPKEPWSPARYAEALAHEYTHHALFLEDMTRGVFSRPVSEMDTAGVVRSAILRRPRGYDKSFHSALVSLVIVQLGQRLGDDRSHLLAPLATTLAELREKGEFLTDNGLAVLDEMEQLHAAVEAGARP
jgi:hypothetical protein